MNEVIVAKEVTIRLQKKIVHNWPNLQEWSNDDILVHEFFFVQLLVLEI